MLFCLAKIVSQFKLQLNIHCFFQSNRLYGYFFPGSSVGLEHSNQPADKCDSVNLVN